MFCCLSVPPYQLKCSVSNPLQQFKCPFSTADSSTSTSHSTAAPKAFTPCRHYCKQSSVCFPTALAVLLCHTLIDQHSVTLKE